MWQIIFCILNQSDENAPADLNQKSTDWVLPPQWDAFPKQMHCLLQFGIETHYVTFCCTLQGKKQKTKTYHFSSFGLFWGHFFTIRWKKNRKTLGWYQKKIDSGTSAALCLWAATQLFSRHLGFLCAHFKLLWCCQLLLNSLMWR